MLIPAGREPLVEVGPVLRGEVLAARVRPRNVMSPVVGGQIDEPNRFRGLHGTALAAAQAGAQAKAKLYFSRLVELAKQGDSRPEIAAARGWLSGN